MTELKVKPNTSSSGQILVIFAGGLVTLLLIAAIVIDVGFVFMMLRHEQNAADPGALAAARYLRPVPNYAAMKDVACEFGRKNGFRLDVTTATGCASSVGTDEAVLVVNWPPRESAGMFSGRIDAVEVVITRLHRSFLAGIVGMSQFRVSANAVGIFSNGNSNTSSLIALDPSAECATGRTHGTGDINIVPAAPGVVGGYVHVNSTCGTTTPDNMCETGSGTGALAVVGSGRLTAPATYVVGTCKANGGLVSTLTEGAVRIGDPLADVPEPNLADYPAGRCGPTGPALKPGDGGCRFTGSATISLSPGIYYGGWEIKNDVTVELAPGMYIIAGGGIRLENEASLTSVQGGSGAPAPVMIFNTDDPSTNTGQANIDLNARGFLKLSAIASGPYKGILLWNDDTSSNPRAIIDLKGQAGIDVSGTIYSPLGLVNLEGGSTGSNTAAVQIIAWQWDVGGNALLTMPYNPSKIYQFEQKGLVE